MAHTEEATPMTTVATLAYHTSFWSFTLGAKGRMRSLTTSTAAELRQESAEDMPAQRISTKMAAPIRGGVQYIMNQGMADPASKSWFMVMMMRPTRAVSMVMTTQMIPL